MGSANRAGLTFAAVSIIWGCGTLLGVDDDPPAASATDASVEASATVADGAVAPADAGDDAAVERCDGPKGCERVVFVSSGTLAAKRVPTADDYCTALAGAASADARIQGRTFIAWTSRGTVRGGEPPTKAFSHGKGRYFVVSAAGERTIASDWDDLVDGTLASGIDIDENGAVMGGQPVWTGVRANGQSGVADCKDWGDEEGTEAAVGGVAGAIDASWSASAQVLPCDAAAHVYCFER